MDTYDLIEGINQGGVAGPWCAPGYYEHPPKTDPSQSGGIGRPPEMGKQKTVQIDGASEGWYQGHFDRIRLVREGDQVNVGPYAFEVKQTKHEAGMVKLILQAGDGGPQRLGVVGQLASLRLQRPQVLLRFGRLAYLRLDFAGLLEA